jgi:1-phosphofructokinase family hexose kinase
MIHTLTLNPSLDTLIWIEEIKRSYKKSFDELKQYSLFDETTTPGGKGICVSRALANLGIKNTALGYIGGSNGKELAEKLSVTNKIDNKKFDNQKIIQEFTEIKGETRENLIVNNISLGIQSIYKKRGPRISLNEFNEIKEKLNRSEKLDIVVVGGSLPRGLSIKMYLEILDILKSKDVRIVLDASGPALINGIDVKPDIIKPNIEEIQNLAKKFHVKINDWNNDEEIFNFARKINEYGIKIVLVSLGPRGIILVSDNEEYHAIPPKKDLKLSVRNTVGAGDSAVAGFISEWQKKPKNLIDSLIYAVAAGTASTYRDDINLCQYEDFIELVPQICLMDPHSNVKLDYNAKSFNVF